MAEYEKRGYLLENFRLFHLRSERGEKVDFHYHEFCKMLLLLSGQGSYIVDGKRYLLSAGDIVLIGSRSVHKPELSDDAAYERIIIYVSPEYLQKMSASDCDLLSLFSGEKGHVLRLKEQRRKAVFALAARLERELSNDAFGRSVLSQAELLHLLVELGRSMEDPAANLPRPSVPQNRRVVEIMEYLDGNLSEEIDIDALAERFFISKFYMMRLFQKETGTTIHAYLTQRRLLKARELMDSGMRAMESCYACGFHSYSSFTRAYGKFFGTTPTGRIDAHLVRAEAPE
ncbi:MAG: helix-turn-helix domain-containing protein [Oscillospiraceae bacterium]|nr:helix-turn-helix domain-containing protein [Oscillospiraceae bacterium]